MNRSCIVLTGTKQGLGVAYQRGFDRAVRELHADLLRDQLEFLGNVLRLRFGGGDAATREVPA